MVKSTDNNKKSSFSVGLDIGTSKVCIMISQLDESGQGYKFLGVSLTESEGLSRGTVNNIDKVTNAIKKVKEQVENQTGQLIEEVVVGIAGDHIQYLIQKGLVTVTKENSEISQDDVDRLLDEVNKTTISADRKILHTIPLIYIVDSIYNTNDPVGMAGVRLESEVMLITSLNSAINNLTRCVERAGLKIKDLVLEPLAASHAVLSDSDKEMGVAVVDIGGGTIDIAIYHEKVLKYTSVIAVGGKFITSDIRKVLGITEVNAESIKKEYGTCNQVEHDSIINIPLGNGNKPKEINRSELNEIIRARVIEMLQFVKYNLKESQLENELSCGVYLTGGVALMDGIADLATKVLDVPVNIGIPQGFSMAALAPDISSPMYATAVGLTLLGHEKNEEENKTKLPIEAEIKVKKPIDDGEIEIDDEEVDNENNITKVKTKAGKFWEKFKEKIETM